MTLSVPVQATKSSEARAKHAKPRKLYGYAKHVERARCEESYYYFFKKAWQQIEPETELVTNWHIKYLCDVFQHEVERIAKKIPKEKDIIVNIAPRSLKSRILTIFSLPWAWTKYPWFKLYSTSYSDKLSIDHSMASRSLVQSEWYQDLWEIQLRKDQNTKRTFQNTQNGYRKQTSVGGSILGQGADIIVGDDLQDPTGADSEAEIEEVNSYWSQTLYSRLNDQRFGMKFNIQQRLSEKDLTGYLLSEQPDKFRHICIPSEITEESEDVKPASLKKYYKEGLMFPSRFSRFVLEDAKLPTNLGSWGYASQHLQSPSPPGGGMFKEYHWAFWKYPEQNLSPPVFENPEGGKIQCRLYDLPESFDRVIDSWDPALKGEVENDDVAGVKAAKSFNKTFILKIVDDQMGYNRSMTEINKLFESNYSTSKVLIEDTASGPNLLESLKEQIPCCEPVKVGKLSKENRARISDNLPYQGQQEAGMVILPHPEVDPLTNRFIKQHKKFPKGAQDGLVDAGGQAVRDLVNKRPVWPYFQPHGQQSIADIENLEALRQNRSGENDWYAGIFMAQEGTLYICIGYWSKRQSIFFIVGQIYATSNISIDAVSMKFNELTPPHLKGVYGNNRMFEKNKIDTAQMFNKGIRGEKNTICIEPFQYNREGAIKKANLLWKDQQLKVRRELRRVIQQCSSWSEENNHKIPEDHGLCEAICLMIPQVYQTAMRAENIQKVDGYSPIKDTESSPGVSNGTEKSWEAM